MFQPFRFRAVHIFIAGAMTLVSVACSNDNPSGSVSSNVEQAAPTATPSAKPLEPPKPTSSLANQITEDSSGENYYELAQNKAYSAANISQSAQSPQDWKLVESQWQEAIALLKKVPASSPTHVQAKSKIAQYQRNLAQAQQQSDRPSSAAVVLSNPDLFQAPIKARLGGTLTIDVTFNGKYTFTTIVDTGASSTVITQEMADKLGVIPDSFAIADTPSAKGVKFEVGKVKSIEVGGALLYNVPVVIAPQLEIGLLGQDFLSLYDITIKQDVIEFQAR